MSRPRTLLAGLAVLAGLLALGWLLMGPSERPHDAPLGTSEDGSDRPEDRPDLLSTDGESVPGADTDPHGGGELGAARRPHGLRGEVHDERGQGLPGATVELRRMDPRSLRGAPYPDGPVLASTRTERDGSFALADETEGWLRVTASAPGRARVGERIASTGAYVILVLPPAGTLAVDVRDDEGRGVPGAAVEVRAGATVATATADAAGRAIVADAAPGSVRVQASAEGHGAALAGPFTIRAGETTTALVRLPRAVRLAGTVLGPGGAILPDVEVHLARPGHGRKLEVDSRGRFGPVAAGGVGERVLLAAAAKGYAPLKERVILRARGVQEVLLELQPAEAWAGRVLDAHRGPVAGATVSYTGDGVSDAARETPGGASTTTDSQGRFSLPPPRPPAPGRRVILAARKGAAVAALALRPGQLKPEPLELVLQEGTTVWGRAVDADGHPVAGAIVRVTPSWRDIPRGVHPDAAASRLLLANEEGCTGMATATDAQGNWRIAGVPPGPYVVYFEHRGTTHRRAEVLKVPGAPTSAGTEVLGGGRTLLGEVVDERGKPVARAQVLALEVGNSSVRARSATGTDGSFELPGLDARVYTVVVTATGRGQARVTADLKDSRDQALRIELDEPAVLVLDVTRDGAPYAGLLTLSFAESGTGRALSQRRSVQVAGGRVEIPDAPPGTWTLDGFATAGLRGRAEGVALDAGRTTSARLALTAAATLSGRVLTPGGRPVAQGHVTASLVGSGTRLEATTTADGAFLLEGLAPGAYDLFAWGHGGAPAAQTVSVASGDDAEVTVRLDPSGALEVHALDEFGHPAAEARLSFLVEGGAVHTLAPARTDRSGTAIQGDLPAGRLLVHAQGVSGSLGSAQAVVAAGTTTRVEIRLLPRER